VRFNFPVDFVTAPLIADLFLLAILAIHAREVSAGTIGDNNIYPYEIMIFFITLAYIAISIDASGLIRYLAFRVLQWGGKVGHRLFLYLYVFFFGVSSFIGNDPVILSGTAFLAYMTRVSSNITHPRAWIHTQFAVANIASAILVSSNPTNLVLAGAFNIKFVDYTANMIVPVVITAIVLFPFLLYIVFANEELIPLSIDMHELSEEAQARPAVNPNIPNARGAAEEEEARRAGGDQRQLLSLEEIMNPYIDSRGASVGAVIMTVTLISVLVINAVSDVIGRQPVYYITLPAAVLMLSWDLSYGWLHRKETREIARKGREEIELAHLQRAMEEEETVRQRNSERDLSPSTGTNEAQTDPRRQAGTEAGRLDAEQHHQRVQLSDRSATRQSHTDISGSERTPSDGLDDEKRIDGQQTALSIRRDTRDSPQSTTLVSLCRRGYRWSQETFPTVTAVISHLPFALIPFAFTMFVLVQALVSAGWIAVFAYGWDHWVNKTGTLGAIGGMAFLSVVLCNVCRLTVRMA
jgi:Na+/H+ antiporter NhaD/arsenite permease-like protein